MRPLYLIPDHFEKKFPLRLEYTSETEIRIPAQTNKTNRELNGYLELLKVLERELKIFIDSSSSKKKLCEIMFCNMEFYLFNIAENIKEFDGPLGFFETRSK